MEFDFREINCPVCGESNFRAVGYRGGEAHHSGSGVRTRIVRCSTCTHQYPNPMPFPIGDLGELYSNTDEYFANHEIEGHKSSALGLVGAIEERLGRKGRLLDIGSGRGEVLWAARERGWESVGVEASAEFIEFGRKHLSVEARAAPFEKTGFERSSFDAVIMNGLIEHLYDPAAVLSEVKRVLKPDGWLYFDAPNEDGLYMAMGNAYMRLRGRDWVVVLAPTFPPFHVQGFNPASVKTLLKQTGFIVRDFNIHGDVFSQMGPQTLRKRLEFFGARLANSVGNLIGKGSYITIWAQCR